MEKRWNETQRDESVISGGTLGTRTEYGVLYTNTSDTPLERYRILLRIQFKKRTPNRELVIYT